MPELSTHINFIKHLNDINFNDYDLYYLTLGSIAPDYYVVFKNKEKACLSHFKEKITDKPNIYSFKNKISNLKLSYYEKSYVMGYYYHLWLDNYFNENIKSLPMKKSGYNSFIEKKFIKENIKNYDLKCIINFINSISLSNSIEYTHDILPVPIKRANNILRDLKFKSSIVNLELSCPVLIDNNDYNEFIIKSVNNLISSNDIII